MHPYSPSPIRFGLQRTLAAAAFAAALSLSATCHADEAPAHTVSAANLPDAPSAVATDARTIEDAGAIGAGESSSLLMPSSMLMPGEATASPDPQNTQHSTMQSILFPRIKFVGVGQIAPKQNVHDKIILGVRESVTPFAILGWTVSAGWSHLIDSSPNYGTNRQAFAQRFGAAAALNTSKEIFSDALLASVFHQDPRYYQLGSSHTFTTRVLYAATRPIVGRTDGGRTIPNYAFILGTGGAAALTHTYYPERNVTPGQVMQTWATSLGGSAAGYLVSEFGGEIVGWLHIRKHE